MNVVEPPSFETTGHKRIYEYVEQHGAVSPNGIHDQVQLESDQVDEIVAALKRDGYLTKYDGRLQLALGITSETTHQLNGPVVTIRPARQEDLPVIIDTIQHVIATMLYPSAESLATRLTRDGVLKRHNDAETRMVFLPTVDDDIVGWVHVGASKLQRIRQTVEMTLGVRTGYRDQGIGSQLLERGCEWAASSTYQKACQRLPMTNEHALSFLESHNWEIETIRRNHYDGDDERIDEVEIAIEL
jgi:L-amino acid N-acyltransferase YncA